MYVCLCIHSRSRSSSASRCAAVQSPTNRKQRRTATIPPPLFDVGYRGPFERSVIQLMVSSGLALAYCTTGTNHVSTTLYAHDSTYVKHQIDTTNVFSSLIYPISYHYIHIPRILPQYSQRQVQSTYIQPLIIYIIKITRLYRRRKPLILQKY